MPRPMKRVLMIAYHFPPLAGSSGIQRTLRFVQHLPALGWEPIVLTASPRAYELTSDDLLGEVPPKTVVRRAFALDAARHLAIAGRFPAAFACPDRWISWRFAAVAAGRNLIREYRPDVIWSTYPIATAHVIGDELQQRSGLPWIADFRDPMAQEGYPEDPRVWQRFRQIEERAIQHARFSVFTARGAARMYRERYPAMADRVMVIQNGFDEESFDGVTGPGMVSAPLNPGKITLLHSGIVYRDERDPSCLFAALRHLIDAQMLDRDRIRVRFRAPGPDSFLRMLTQRHALEDLVELLPPLPYREALTEMVRADGLLVLQASSCNEQIPAKVYEYLRAGRPIAALTDPAGDTAGVLRDAGLHNIARLDTTDDIAAMLRTFVEDLRVDRAALPHRDYVAGASRARQTQYLADLLERACA